MKRTEMIMHLLQTGARNTIEKFNAITNLTDEQLQKEYEKSFN